MPGEGFPQMLVQTFSSNKPNDLKFHQWNYICSNPFYSSYIHNCIMIFLKPFNKLFYKFFVQKAVAALCWSSHEEIPHAQWQRRNPSKMVGGANLHLESNPTPARDAQRAQTYLVHTRTQGPHRDWDRPVFEHLLWRYQSAADCLRDRGSGWGRLEYGMSPLGGGHH